MKPVLNTPLHLHPHVQPIAEEIVQPRKTYVAIILDKSGSMENTKESAMIGFNEQIQQLKEDAQTQEIYCSLITFNGNVFEHLWNVPAQELAEANAEAYICHGGTAMRDAVGYTAQKLIDTTDTNDKNNAYLVVCISDGDTRDDKHYSIEKLRALTAPCQATKRWTFTYIGCNAAYMHQLAYQTATPIANMAAWENKSASSTKRGFENIRARQQKYFAERAMGQIATANYANDMNDVADFCVASAESAPSPVLVTADQLPDIALREVSSTMPQYEPNPEFVYQGGVLFGNSAKVNWRA